MMLRPFFLFPIVFLAAAAGVSLWASPALDAQYGMRKAAVLVINTLEEPIQAVRTEVALGEWVRSQSRFEFSDEGFAALKLWAGRQPALNIGDNTIAADGHFARALPEPLQTAVAGLFASHGVQLVFVAKLQSTKEGYVFETALVATEPLIVLKRFSSPVRDTKSLDSFARAATEAAIELSKTVPFDGTVLSREDDRVILDRGLPNLHKGTRLPVYTFAAANGGLVFEETGTIVITRAERNLSFAKVVLEKAPQRMTAGNKVRFRDGTEPYDNAPPAMLPSGRLPAGDRGLASLFAPPDPSAAEALVLSEAPVADTRARLGYVDAGLAASIVSLENKKSDGTVVGSGGGMQPGVRLHGELWLTSAFYADMSLQFGFGSVAAIPGVTDSESASTSQFRIAAGYKYFFYGPDFGPSLTAKVGFGSQSYGATASTTNFAFTSIGYQGLLLGFGGKLPLSRTYGVGFEYLTLLFPGASETPVTSGDVSGATSWDVAFSGYYSFRPNLQALAKLVFQNSGAQFTGTGSRTGTPVTSYTQNAQALQFELAYFF